MLKFSPNTDGVLIASCLVEGDEFYHAAYQQNRPILRSITKFRVDRILNRDVVCKSESGKELRFSKKNSVLNCYAVDSPKVKEFSEQILLRTRRIAAEKIISDYPVGKNADNELLAAIEAFGARMKANHEDYMKALGIGDE